MSNLRTDFNTQLNEFINRFGLRRGEFILRTILEKPKSSIDEDKRTSLSTRYIIAETAKVYGLTNEEVVKGTSRKASEARCAVVHLLKTYTQTTYQELTHYLQMKKRAIAYANRMCMEKLEVPRFQREFNEKYKAIEIKLIAFLTKI